VDPDVAPEAAAIADRRVVKVDHAGHWVHHDQLEVFLKAAKAFLATDERR
jgi:pimeloyl-ACP methyl ester carboxylesterase